MDLAMCSGPPWQFKAPLTLSHTPQATPLQDVSHAKVTELDHMLGSQEKVGRFDIPVDDALRVDVEHRLAQLRKVKVCLPHG